MSRISSFVVLIAGVIALGVPATAGAGTAAFTHGVASGDVTSSRAILWTRVDRPGANIKVEVWPNSSCLKGQKVFQRANLRSLTARDFTIKVDATGLAAGTEYCYQFRRGNLEVSPVGRFETAPPPDRPASVNFTYSGDSDGARKPDGSPPFNNFEVLDRAREENGDFFAYIGDTIYADSGFRHPPATTLAEYRAAYKENRDYPALPNLLGSTSIYALLDDHEVQNDFDGQTVDPALYAAGRQAFLEYMPIRPSRVLHDSTCAGDPLYGTFKWGSNIELFVLDERSCRSADVSPICNGDLAPTAPTSIRTSGIFALFLQPSPPAGCLDAIFDPTRTMLGPVQKAKFKQDLATSTAKFKIVISELGIQQFFALPYDRWEGYGAERNEVLSFIRDQGIGNVVFLTTDLHANLVNEVFIDRFENCPTPPGPNATCATANPPTTIANELITGPIATNTFEKEIRAFLPQFADLAVFAFNQVLSIAGLDCRDINRYSYGLVREDAVAGTTNVKLKDDTGAPVTNKVAPIGIPCEKTFGP
jgi:phosphodiesterase/alkaline phosphatase D-like protein